MRIQQNPAQQNFGAIPVTKTIIKRKVPFTPFYQRAEATFVQIERKYDIPALTRYAANNPKGALAAECIFDLKSDEYTHAFAITTQKDNFTELIPEKILGICDGQILHRDGKPIFFLQNIETQSVNNPDAIYHKKNLNILGLNLNYDEKFKNIGRKLLRELIRVLNNSEAEGIELKPIPIKRKSFYEKLGFGPLKFDDSIYEVSRSNFAEFIAKN